MSQRYIRELCVGHCYAWIWTGVYNSNGGLSLCLHASANLIHIFLTSTHNLEPQFVPSMWICTVQICVHSWCSFHGTFKYCYFFEQLCSTKRTIKLACLRVLWQNWVQIEACNQGYILQFFSLKLELWFRSYDILNETSHILTKYSLAYALKMHTTAI